LDNYFQQIIRSSSFSSIETIKKPVAREHLSCVCKWIPREYKKFDWLNEMLVIDWFETYKPYYLTSHKSVAGYYNSLSKCKLLYRKMVSKLNKVLDTTEIKLCSNQLDEIIPKNIPQIMFMKNNIPVVTSKIPSYVNIYKNIGINFYCDSTNDWIKKIEKLIRSENLRRYAANKAYKYVMSKYSKKKFINQWDNILKK
jgi:hypothetical protein